MAQTSQMEEKEEVVWASALSCLFYFVCDRGKILRNRLEGLDIRVRELFLVSPHSIFHVMYMFS